tara:strand:- start:401 stop:835 length:435 start_codon:yes stop_codon:yes gene_type:complete
MLDKLKDIEEIGNKLLSTESLSSIYSDKFAINNTEFKYKETVRYDGESLYVFDVILYTDITAVLPERHSSSFEDFQRIDSQLWDYDLDPIYLSDVILPKKVLTIITSIMPIDIELVILGDKGQVIWDGPSWNKMDKHKKRPYEI